MKKITSSNAPLLCVVLAACGSAKPKLDPEDCTRFPAVVDASHSVARQWNEEVLASIRRDTPAPTIHARNLFHLSALMFDVWSVYGGNGAQYLFTEKQTAEDVTSARREAMSYAAAALLTSRYNLSRCPQTSAASYAARLTSLGLKPNSTTSGNTPVAVGNRAAALYLKTFANDGSNEANKFVDNTGYQAAQPMVLQDGGNIVENPNKWQPLDFGQPIVSQNGVKSSDKVQKYVGPHWGNVKTFALARANADALYVDPGQPPQLRGNAHEQMLADLREVMERSRALTPNATEMIDLSPGVMGNNSLGKNDGVGHALNPVTQRPYGANVVPLGDFGRVLAEFWADGPKSETPPGHWNVVANEVGDSDNFVARFEGAGPALDRLQWDTWLYFALNGALHDAAVSAWQVKRHYETARPICLIRHLASYGQSSDESQPSFNPLGIPLIPGLVELATEASVAGEHAAASANPNSIVIRAFVGEKDSTARGVGWVSGVRWTTYQRATFITPAFPGYISGHSTFSRAAAVVLARFTGSDFFPGGMFEHVAPANTGLHFEPGPSVEVRLQWATYFDAADQAGQSRIWGGIHVAADDFGGRRVGDVVGTTAYQKARTYFGL